MIIGKYKTLDAKRLKPIIDEYLPATEAFYHKSGTHQQMMIGNKDWSKNNFWHVEETIEQVYDKLGLEYKHKKEEVN